MPAAIVLHALAALTYVLLLTVMLAVLLRPLAAADASSSTSSSSNPSSPTTPTAHLGWPGRSALLLGLLLHALGLVQAIIHGSQLYLGWSLALSVAVCLGMMVFWLESLVMRIDGLLVLLLPVAALITAQTALFPGNRLIANASNGWLRLHLLIALIAYGLTTVSALQALLMAALDNALHRPPQAQMHGWRGIIHRVLDAMPPLLTQEHLLFRLIAISFFALTLTVLSGVQVSLQLLGQVFALDHKTVFSLLSWLTFACLLLGRYAWGWRGRRALRGTLLGFAFLILAYSGTHFVLDVILRR